MVALEAMERGRPVIATEIGGLEDVVRDGETGLLVPVSEAGRLAGAMLALARDYDRVRAMGAAARLRAISRFPTRRCIDRTEEVYRFWLDDGNGRGSRNGSRVSAAAARSASKKSQGTR
jgi:glycosyltransferase involved in cell wall biosynthesis